MGTIEELNVAAVDWDGMFRIRLLLSSLFLGEDARGD